MSEYWPVIKIMLMFSLSLSFIVGIAAELHLSYTTPLQPTQFCTNTGAGLVCTGMPSQNETTNLYSTSQPVGSPGTYGDWFASMFETIKGMGYFIGFAANAALSIGSNLRSLGSPTQIADMLQTVVWLSYIACVAEFYLGRPIN